jgi:hypothetical protein
MPDRAPEADSAGFFCHPAPPAATPGSVGLFLLFFSDIIEDMKKKLLVLLSAVLIGLAFHACSMPDSINKPKKIKVKGNLDYDLLLNVSKINVGNMIDDIMALLGELPEGFRLYDAPNYRNSAGKSVQAFLLYYEMSLINSFDPNHYFEIPEFGDGDDSIHQEITIPELSYEEHEFDEIDLKDIFDKIEKTINDAQNPMKVSDKGGPLLALGHHVDLGPFDFTFHQNLSNETIFESMVLYDGTLTVTLTLTDSSGGPPDSRISIELTNIEMWQGEFDTAYRHPADEVRLNGLDTLSGEAVFYLDGFTISNDPADAFQFRIGNIQDFSDITGSPPYYDITITPKMSDILVKSVEGLTIDPVVMKIPEPEEDIEFDEELPPEFIAAEIKTGTLTLSAPLPTTVGPPDTTTYFIRVVQEFNIKIKQDDYVFDDLPPFKGMDLVDQETGNGIVCDLKGQNIVNVKDPDLPFLTFEESNITLYFDNASFNLSDDEAAMGSVKLNDLVIKMEITELASAHIDVSDLLDMDQDDPPSISLYDAAESLKTVTFGQCIPDDLGDDGLPNAGIGILINITEIAPAFNKAGLQLEVFCNDPDTRPTGLGPAGLGSETEHTLAPLKEGKSVIANTKSRAVLDLATYYHEDSPQCVENSELAFNFGLKTNTASDKVIKLGEITPGGEPLKIHGDINFFVNWIEAEVDVASLGIGENGLEGTYPEKPAPPEDSEDPEDPENPDNTGEFIDLKSYMGDYLENLFFRGLEAKVILSGPGMFAEGGALELQNLQLNAVYNEDKESGDKELVNLVSPLQKLDFSAGKISESVLFEVDRNGRKKYPYTNLKDAPPLRNLGIPVDGQLDKIFKDQPEDLYIEYKADVGAHGIITVTPELFEDTEDDQSSFDLQIIVLLPLDFVAGGDNAVKGETGKLTFSSLIDDPKDIFKRASPNDPVNLPNEIKKMPSLHVGIEFPSSLFSGGTLHLFAKDEESGKYPLFPKGITLNGRSIKVKVSGKELNEIMGLTPGKAKLLILEPEIVFSRGKGVTITRNLGLSRIEFGISGNYTINTDDLGLW